MEANFAAIPSLQGPTTAHHSFATLKDIYLESAARSTGLGSEDLVDDLDDPASTTLQANSWGIIVERRNSDDRFRFLNILCLYWFSVKTLHFWLKHVSLKTFPQLLIYSPMIVVVHWIKDCITYNLHFYIYWFKTIPEYLIHSAIRCSLFRWESIPIRDQPIVLKRRCTWQVEVASL